MTPAVWGWEGGSGGEAMAELGNATLIITLALAVYAVAASFSGAWARLPNLVQSGRYALI